MIFTIGCAIVGVLAALMVTSPARKKQIGVPVKATKKSPKKTVASIQLSETDLSGKRKLDYYHLRILKLACEFEVIHIDGTPGNDGFGQKLFGNITDNNGFGDEGILMVAKRRVSQADNSVLCNANNTYPRRVIIRSVGEDESTHASRLAILHAVQAFLVRTDNNRFGYAYVVNDESDLTPTRWRRTSNRWIITSMTC
jgi:hypothetical protein